MVARCTTDRVAARPDASRRPEVADIQRTRLLTAAVQTIDELGYPHTTVAHITARARVSRRTFYELFANRDECLEAVLQNAVDGVRRELAGADLGGAGWREQVRVGLWVILCAFDRDPMLARVCVVQVARAGQSALERREAIFAELARVVDEGRQASTRCEGVARLTAEGLVGAAFAIVHARLLRGEGEPLAGLLGELTGMIVLPYLGAAAARREQLRPLPERPAGLAQAERARDAAEDPLQGLPMRLTYRTARVIEAIALQPEISNRGVAQRAGIADQGQVSKLLARLQRLGLITNTGVGHVKGEPNAWVLSESGSRVAQSIDLQGVDRDLVSSSGPPLARGARGGAV
jgi:AcrR family transcriptional regulator